MLIKNSTAYVIEQQSGNYLRYDLEILVTSDSKLQINVWMFEKVTECPLPSLPSRESLVSKKGNPSRKKIAENLDFVWNTNFIRGSTEQVFTSVLL